MRGPSQHRSAPSPSLSATQQLLFTAICDPVPISDDARALVDGHLEVYADMYWARLRDVLRDAFPAVRAALQDDAFDVHVATLLQRFPSTSPSIDAIGAHFAQVLPAPWNDVAALEWARSQAFVAPDAPTLDFTALQSVPSDQWPRVRLTAHPSLRVLTLRTDPRPTLRGEGAPTAAPTSLVIWRQGFEVFHAPIDDAEVTALRALLAGEVLPMVLAPFGDDATGAFEMLHGWFNEGMVSSIERGD